MVRAGRMVSNLRREDKAAEAAMYDFFPVSSHPAHSFEKGM
jgi:hypothetical protein